MFAVMGVTGQVGGAVATRLLTQGAKVRAIVRDPGKAAKWTERGCEVAIADVNDANSLCQAFAGIEGVFMMLPPMFDPSPGFPEARRATANLHRALTSAQIGRVVALSTIGAQQERERLLYQLHLLEEELGTLSFADYLPEAGMVYGKHQLGHRASEVHRRGEEFSTTAR